MKFSFALMETMEGLFATISNHIVLKCNPVHWFCHFRKVVSMESSMKYNVDQGSVHLDFVSPNPTKNITSAKTIVSRDTLTCSAL